MRWSIVARHRRDSRVQSRRVGARPSGSVASAVWDVGQRNPQLPRGAYDGQPAQFGAGVAPLVARRPRRGNQAVLLVEAHRGHADARTRGEIPDAERGLHRLTVAA